MTWDISGVSLLGRAEGGLHSGRGEEMLFVHCGLSEARPHPQLLWPLQSSQGEARAGFLARLVQQREGSVGKLVHVQHLD